MLREANSHSVHKLDELDDNWWINLVANVNTQTGENLTPRVYGPIVRNERPGFLEFSQGVREIHRKTFHGFHFCRICPVNRAGYDDFGLKIPLEAHHALVPYAVDKNQDPSGGILLCRHGHHAQIHIPGRCGLSAQGLELKRLFSLNPHLPQYNIDNTCFYKSTDTDTDFTSAYPSIIPKGVV